MHHYSQFMVTTHVALSHTFKVIVVTSGKRMPLGHNLVSIMFVCVDAHNYNNAHHNKCSFLMSIVMCMNKALSVLP